MTAKRIPRKPPPDQETSTPRSTPPTEAERARKKRRPVRDPFEGWDSVDSTYLGKG